MMAIFSSTVQKSIPILQGLLKVDSKLLSKLMRNKDLLNCVREIVVNLLENHIPISKKHRAQLRQNQSVLIVLASRENSAKYRLLIKPQGQRVFKLLLRATVPIICRSLNGCRKNNSGRSKKGSGFRR